MGGEPIGRQGRGALEGARFFEQVRGPRDDLEAVLAAQQFGCPGLVGSQSLLLLAVWQCKAPGFTVSVFKNYGLRDQRQKDHVL